MSIIEDALKLLQDFLAPELRELFARAEALEERMNLRLDAFEKEVDTRVEALEERMDARFDSSERLASERHTQTMQAIGRLADV